MKNFLIFVVALFAILINPLGGYVTSQSLGSIEYNWTNADKNLLYTIITLIEKKPLETQKKWVTAIDNALFTNKNMSLRVRAILNAIQLNVRDNGETTGESMSNETNVVKDLNNSTYTQSLKTKFEADEDNRITNLDKSYLQEGSFSARYLPSADYTNDSIRIFDGITTRTFALSYNSSNANILKTMKRELEGDITSDLIGNGGVHLCEIIGFSPSGYYVHLGLCGREYSYAIMMDVSNGKTVLQYSSGPELWTPNRKQFVWGSEIGMGGGDLGLNITKVGSFPEYLTIMDDRQIEKIIAEGDDFLAIKSSLLDEEMTHYYITLVKPSTYKVLQEVRLAR